MTNNNNYSSLVGQWKEIRTKVDNSVKVQPRKGTYTLIDSRDLFLLDKLGKELKDQWWEELDTDIKFIIDRNRWLKELSARNNPKVLISP